VTARVDRARRLDPVFAGSLRGRRSTRDISASGEEYTTEESPPILNGLLWQLGDEEMRMVATHDRQAAGDSET
jgi:hypothetical protein